MTPDRFIRKALEKIDLVLLAVLDTLPVVETWAMWALELAFGPKLILQQLFLVTALHTSMVGMQSVKKVVRYIMSLSSETGRKEIELKEKLRKANTYEEYLATAEELDQSRGFDKWRSEDNSPFYDSEVLKKRIEDTLEMMNRGDIFNLIFRLRGGLSRNQFGIQHEGLFLKALAGTKHIVERYHETVCSALNFVCDSPIADDEIPTDAKLAFFNETRHAYGRTALLLSGGAFLGFYNVGVAKALWNEGMLPRVMSGASAGSMIAGIIGVRTEEELRNEFIRGGFSSLRTDFLKQLPVQSPVGRRLQSTLPSWMRFLDPILNLIFDGKIVNLDTEHFKKIVKHNIGMYTFQEAFDRSGRIINITVAPLNPYEAPRLLNYLTTPHVCVWSAVVASCAIPGMFDSVNLYVKEPNGEFKAEHEWSTGSSIIESDPSSMSRHGYSDGSLENDLPMQQLSELFNVNHFIVSQVNAHSALLSSLTLRTRSPILSVLVAYVRFLKIQCRDWLKNVIGFIAHQSSTPWGLRRGPALTLTQDYEGKEADVTITPWAGHISILQAWGSILKNPESAEEYDSIVLASQRSTWPFMPRIKSHCSVESTLDKCVQRLRRRIVEESTMKHQHRIIKSHIGTINDHERINDSDGSKAHVTRVPSFYTSRSIINLSGLSVADPVLVPSLNGSLVPHLSLSSRTPPTSPRSFLGFGLEPVMEGDFDSTPKAGGSSSSTVGEDGCGKGQMGLDGVGMSLSPRLNEELYYSDDKDFADVDASAYLTVPLNDGPRAFNPRDINKHNSGGGDAAGSSISRGSSDNSNLSRRRTHLNDGIVKTTAMANFYYKRNNSSDKITTVSLSDGSVDHSIKAVAAPSDDDKIYKRVLSKIL